MQKSKLPLKILIFVSDLVVIAGRNVSDSDPPFGLLPPLRDSPVSLLPPRRDSPVSLLPPRHDSPVSVPPLNVLPPTFCKPPPIFGAADIPPEIQRMHMERIHMELQRQKSQEKQRREPEAGIDLSLLAALAGNCQVSLYLIRGEVTDHVQSERRPMPDTRGGAITAEDLEASFLTDPDNSLSGGDSPGDSRPKRPPGFGAPGMMRPPAAQQMIQQQLIQRHIMEQNNLRQRQLSGDVLGIQGLANLGLSQPPAPGNGLPPGLAPGPFGPLILPYR